MIIPETLARFEALLEPGTLRAFSDEELDQLRGLNYSDALLRHMLPLATDDYRAAADADFQLVPVPYLIEWLVGSPAVRLLGCWPFAEGCNGDIFAFDLWPDPAAENPPVVRLSHDALPFEGEELLAEWLDDDTRARFGLPDDAYDAMDELVQLPAEQQREVAGRLRYNLQEADDRIIEFIGNTFEEAVAFWAAERFRTGE